MIVCSGITAALDLNSIVNGDLEYTGGDQWVPTEMLYGSVVISACTTMILLDAKTTHFMQLVASYVITYSAAYHAQKYIGSVFGTYLAALVSGSIGNLYGRITHHPAIEVWLFGILMLTPGAIGR